MNFITSAKRIKGYDYISFSIMNLLTSQRVVGPELWELLELIYNNSHKKQLQYRERRIRAERFVKSSKRGYCTTLEELYDFTGYPKTVKQELIQMEQQWILYNCVVNPKAVETVKLYQSSGIPVILTANTLVSGNTVMAILQMVNLDNSLIYISSDLKLEPTVNSVLDYAAKDLNTSKDMILHLEHRS